MTQFDLNEINMRTERGKASVSGRAVRSLVKLTFNMNPVSCKDQVKVMRRLGMLPYAPNEFGFSKRMFEKDGGKFVFYSKNGGEHKNIVYVIHGGAFVLSLSWYYTRFTRAFSAAGHDADVLFVDYHVSPEHDHSLALEEALTGWNWLLESGYKEENIVTVGDSAGANLAINLNFKLREEGRNLPAGCVYISPWIDMTASSVTYVQNFKVDTMFGNKSDITAEMIEQLLNSRIFCFADGLDRTSKEVSPVFGTYENFPPSYITSGGDEMLLGDALILSQKLADAGATVTHDITSGMFHIFPTLYPLMPEAVRAIRKISNFISTTLPE